MNKQQALALLIGLIIIAISIFVGIRVVSPMFNQPEDQPGVITDIPKEQKTQEYVPIVFIGKNANGEEVYKVIKREYDPEIDGSKLRHALELLILGPKQSEKATGTYSEVPANTNILHIYEREDKVIIDLSSGFSYGGGTESIYKRLFQLIKTVNRNTAKPAYLYINGKQADVIGGDGIMITQPLNENSIGE